MQEINQENDDHQFKIHVKDKGAIYIDGFELISVAAGLKSIEDGEDPTRQDVIDSVKEVCWCDEGVEISTFTDHELFAAGTKVLLKIKKLGNE